MKVKVKKAGGQEKRAAGHPAPPVDAEAQAVLARLAEPPLRPAPRDPAAPKRAAPGKPQQVRRGERRSGPVDDGHTPDTYRLFYALKVPRDVAGTLAQAQRHLKGNWRAVRPDQLHVTLAYLPAVPPQRVPELRALGQALAPQFGTLDVRLRGTGYFPNEGSPRVWFVKAEAEGLTELAEALRAGIRDLGLPVEDLPFRAHVTLARKKGPAPRVPPLIFGAAWHAGSFTLQRSLLQKTGPIYEQAGAFHLRDHPATPPPASEPAPHESPRAPQEPT
ncbi:2'-5' RNA ligase [Deinococcus metalli]|uniref:RNA 2',3'-cyclic phosphodiesterase n=1 Tax=Deinococcus metalli TaxID=1141878 RepID=A0A7W8KFJ2_9DEIO|nr:RNA 2',3'-cyclic phosphodiesterase [Deinococcus metalli]MBB5376081.1 2'-5' RNA ligase [Deinococcus metalli]GHF40948.1 RNA 2',3'-cyclic phosphodiesterase [Deinococcus metalli]